MSSAFTGNNKTVFAIVVAVAMLTFVSAGICCFLYSEDDTDSIAASDYSDTGNWLKIPEKIDYEVDVFYLYPSGFSPSYEGEECEIDNEGMREKAVEYYMCQATAFEGLANIYAPFYRQIDAGSLAGLSQPEMIEREQGAPRADVYAALDFYFENYNDGRPFILAGHSQGSMMIYIILDEYMEEHADVYGRMVASYMIGNAATKSWLADNPHVSMAAGAGDTGVLVTWNTEGPGNIGKYNMVVPEDSVCINPINWTTGGTYASADENLGCLDKNEDGTYSVVDGYADAQVNLERGSVIVSSVDPEKYALPEEAWPMFGPESYHGSDYAFFYQNIHENAKLRISNYLDLAQER